MLTLKKYLTVSALALTMVGQMNAVLPFGFITAGLVAYRNYRETTPIKEFTRKDIAFLDKLMDVSPARNILWGAYCEEQGESTLGLRAENKQSLRLFMSRQATFDSRCWSSDVHRPIGYSMPAICSVVDHSNAPTTEDRRMKGLVCAKFLKAVNSPFYQAEKLIKANELLAAQPDRDGKEIFEEAFGEPYTESN